MSKYSKLAKTLFEESTVGHGGTPVSKNKKPAVSVAYDTVYNTYDRTSPLYSLLWRHRSLKLYLEAASTLSIKDNNSDAKILIESSGYGYGSKKLRSYQGAIFELTLPNGEFIEIEPDCSPDVMEKLAIDTRVLLGNVIPDSIDHEEDYWQHLYDFEKFVYLYDEKHDGKARKVILDRIKDIRKRIHDSTDFVKFDKKKGSEISACPRKGDYISITYTFGDTDISQFLLSSNSLPTIIDKAVDLLSPVLDSNVLDEYDNADLKSRFAGLVAAVVTRSKIISNK